MKRRDFLLTTGIAASFTAMGYSNLPLTIPSVEQDSAEDESLIRVACAISKGTTNIDWVGPCAAFETWAYNEQLKKYQPRFKIYTVSETLEERGGIVAAYTFENAPAPKIIIVPAQQGSDELIAWLKTNALTAEVIMSVCVGAKHLAEAGLLDGKMATTHHESISQFKDKFPKVNWVEGKRFVKVSGNIYTSGGLTAGIDLGLHIVEKYFGRVEALKVADHLEYESKSWMIG